MTYNFKIKKILEALLYPREEMPQVKTENMDKAIEMLRERGITVAKEKVAPDSMKPSQTSIDNDKVDSIAKDLILSKLKPIVISLDNYIVDGHHRWAAAKKAGYGKDRVTVYRIKLSRRQAIQVYNEVSANIG